MMPMSRKRVSWRRESMVLIRSAVPKPCCASQSHIKPLSPTQRFQTMRPRSGAVGSSETLAGRVIPSMPGNTSTSVSFQFGGMGAKCRSAGGGGGPAGAELLLVPHDMPRISTAAITPAGNPKRALDTDGLLRFTCSESLQERDQRFLVRIGQARLAFAGGEVVRAEVVAL